MVIPDSVAEVHFIFSAQCICMKTDELIRFYLYVYPSTPLLQILSFQILSVRGFLSLGQNFTFLFFSSFHPIPHSHDSFTLLL